MIELFILKGSGDDEIISDYCCARKKHQVLSTILDDPEQDEMITLLSLEYMANLHSTKLMCHRDIKYANIFFNLGNKIGKRVRGESLGELYTDCDTIMLIQKEDGYVVNGA